MRTILLFAVLLHHSVLAASYFGGNGTLAGNSTLAYTGWYVDSVAGNDANTGRHPLDPLKTLATLTTNNLVGASIYLKRGSMLRESFKIPTNSSVQPYGIVSYAPLGSYDAIKDCRPIISGADLLTNANFTLTAGQSNVYEYAYTPLNWSVNEGGNVITKSNVFIVWENDVRMSKCVNDTGYYSNLNQVITNVPAWWYNPAVHKIYIHATGGIDPRTNSNVYEASVRPLVFFSGDNFSLYDLQGEKGYQDDGSHTLTCFSGLAGGNVKLCIFRQGYNHIGGVANTVDNKNPLAFDSCVFADPDPFQSGNAAPTAFVAYKDLVTAPYPLTYVTNCSAYAKSILSGNIGYFAHHSTVGSFSQCVISNSYAMNWDYGASSSYSSEDLDSPIGFTTINCNIGLHALGRNLNALNSTNFHCAVAGIQGAVTNVTGCRFYDCSGFPIQLFNMPNLSSGITNCILHGTGTYAISVPSYATNTVTTVSNTSSGFSAFYIANPANSSNTITYSDYNDYFGLGVNFAVGLPTNNSYAQWLAAFPALDTHSVTTDPHIVVPWYPSNYVYAVAADIPMMLVQPISSTVSFPTTNIFNCLSSGLPSLLYQWLSNGIVIPGATAITYGAIANSTNDSADYSCIITNNLGSVTSSVASLIVNAPIVFSPTNVSGYPSLAWYVADDVGSTPVATWTDRWTNGWNLTAAGTARPTRVAANLNGHNTISFDGVANAMQNTSYTNPQPTEVFMVAALTNKASVGFWDGTDINLRVTLRTDSTGKLTEYAGGSVITVADPLTNKYCVFDVVFNGASSTLYTNNTQCGSGNPGSGVMQGLTIGGRFDGSQNANYVVAEWFSYKTNLSTVMRSNAFYYCTNKYNLVP